MTIDARADKTTEEMMRETKLAIDLFIFLHQVQMIDIDYRDCTAIVEFISEWGEGADADAAVANSGSK